MYNHLLYLAYWFINSAVLYAAGILIPAVRLEDGRFSSIETAIYAGFWITFMIWVWWDFAIARKFLFNNTASFFVFLIVNSISIWAVSRFYFFTGFILTDYVWALGLGVAATILQRMVRGMVVQA